MSRSMQQMERLISAEVGGYAGGGGLTTESAPADQTSSIARPAQAKTSAAGERNASAPAVLQTAPWRLSDKAPDLRIQPVGQSAPSPPSEESKQAEETRSDTGKLMQNPKAQVSETLFPQFYLAGATAAKDSLPLDKETRRSQPAESEPAAQAVALPQTLTPAQKTQKRLDIYEQIKQRLAETQKSITKSSAAREAEQTTGAPKGIWEAEEEETAGTEQGYERTPKTFSMAELQKSPWVQGPALGSPTESYREVMTQAEISAQARLILGQYQDFASYLEDKYRRAIRAARVYLKQGRFYRAADAYTLACIYKSNDPVAYAGKSQALFAAGEYVSSALYLSRAVEISSQLARSKVDLVALLGGKNQLQKRIADAKEWLKNSGAAELQLLLGYVYYQTGDLQQAKQAIDAAYKQMPGSMAVKLVKKAIEDAIKQSNIQ